MLLYIENNFSIVNGCISNKSGFNWIRIFAFLKCFGSALWLQRHSRVQVSYFLTQLEFSDLFVHDKRVYSAGLIREIPTESGSRLIRTYVLKTYTSILVTGALPIFPRKKHNFRFFLYQMIHKSLFFLVLLVILISPIIRRSKRGGKWGAILT